MLNEEKVIVELLYKKFGCVLLSKSECSRAIGRSISSLDRDRKNGCGIPYLQENRSNVYYSITDIAKYMSDRKIKTVSIDMY
jgi:hypothetical protein